MRKPLLAIFSVGEGFGLRAAGGGGLPQQTCTRTPNGSRKRIAILYLRCPARRLRGSSRTLELIDGQKES
jgi:hypothetical protein